MKPGTRGLTFDNALVIRKSDYKKIRSIIYEGRERIYAWIVVKHGENQYIIDLWDNFATSIKPNHIATFTNLWVVRPRSALRFQLTKSSTITIHGEFLPQNNFYKWYDNPIVVTW